ncbi:flp pilus assembly protein TadG [alpha proteobacterium Q-1]|nr:flp pilus assembly protein TadG [alpha proteobacterium Q-1]
MIRLMTNHRRGWWRGFCANRKGSILIETAMVVSFLGLLALGSIDFGMAYVRKAEMDNAVRAGVQFGLARHPSMSEIASGIVVAQDVRNAVWGAADFLDADPGAQLEVSFSCQCPDGTAVACTSTAISTLACTDRQTYLEIRLEHDYEMIFAYPGLGQRLSMASNSAVRLN